MTKTVREVQIKFFLSHLDAIKDENYFLETVEIEDNHFPLYLESKVLSGTFRIKKIPRGGSFLETIYLKTS
jgi:hypothetical protein